MAIIVDPTIFDKIVLNGVHQTWIDAFTSGELNIPYKKMRDGFIQGKFNITTLSPSPKNLLAAFRQDPDKIRLCILGQEPYLTPKTATGI